MSMPRIAELPSGVDALRALVIQMHEENARRLEQRDARIAQLEEMVRLLRHHRFGAKSERAPGEQPGLFNEAEATLDAAVAAGESTCEVDEAADPTQVPAHTRAKPGRRPLPAWIERVEVLHDLSDAEKRCATHDIALTSIGHDVSEQLEIIPMQVRVIRNVRPKYVCAKCRDKVWAAPVVPQLIPKSVATPGLLAYVAVSKYADALPLYRLSGMLERSGIDLSRATLAQWMVRFGEAVERLIARLRLELRAYDIVQADETRFRVLKEPEKPATSHSYLWALRGGPPDRPLLLFEYDASRSKKVANRLLEGFQGYVQTDGYGGYTEVGQSPGIVHVGCFAHARRKFVEAIDGNDGRRGQSPRGSHKASASRARQGLAFIQDLYAIERTLVEATPDERYRVRQERSRPVLAALHVWLDRVIGEVPPQGLTGKALSYLSSQWPKLVRVFDDGRLPLDTNGVENAIRPFVLGRKNWLFADTVHGAKASANLYSLIETAKANGLEPFAYLRYIAEHLPRARSEAEVEALLPHRIDRARLADPKGPPDAQAIASA
jgi:transposase